jgi:hypothetical protein
MSIVINLEPEEEDALVRLAAERGLTPEAYVHRLILGLTHAGKEGQKSSLVARLRSAIAGFQRSHPFSDLADDELRAMRTRVSEHKERVVEAIAQAEMLDRMRDRQQRLIVEKELQALTHARAGYTQKSLRRFQESCVFGERAKALHEKHKEASEQAIRMLALFREEEGKARRILSPAQTAAADAVQGAGGAHLPAPEMEQRIADLGTPEEWQKRYESWIRSHLDGTNSQDDMSVKFIAPEFSPEELSELELELMCDDLEGRLADAAE